MSSAQTMVAYCGEVELSYLHQLETKSLTSCTVLILASFEWKDRLAAMCGALEWMPPVKDESRNVIFVRNRRSHQLRFLFISGNGLNMPGPGCTLTVGTFEEHVLLLLVDVHSKWMEVHPVKHADSKSTIQKLTNIFATHGLLEMLASDNGSVFTSAEFKEFSSCNAIRHVTTAPYHPSPNGLAEKAVQTFKATMKKMTSGPMEMWVTKFLFHYRLMPHASTGEAPAELFLGHRPQSLLDNNKPDVSTHVRRHQENQKLSHDAHTSARKFSVNHVVFIRIAVKGIIHCLGFLALLRQSVDHCCIKFVCQKTILFVVMLTTSAIDSVICWWWQTWMVMIPRFPISTTKPSVSSTSCPSLPRSATCCSGRIQQPSDLWCPLQGRRRCSNLT